MTVQTPSHREAADASSEESAADDAFARLLGVAARTGSERLALGIHVAQHRGQPHFTRFVDYANLLPLIKECFEAEHTDEHPST